VTEDTSMIHEVPSGKEDLLQHDVEIAGTSSPTTLSSNNVDKSLLSFISNPDTSSRNRLLIDFAIAVVTFAFIGILDKYVEPIKRPFYTIHVDPVTGTLEYVYMGWTDTDIFYPHTDNETFPDYSAFLLGILVPIGCFLILCFVKHRELAERYYVLGYRVYGLMQVLMVTLLVVEIVKLCVGELRPDFLARCQPSLTAPPVCTGDASKIWEGRKSFPSGHSAMMFSFMMYLSMVLAHEFQLFDSLRWRASRSLDDDLQLLSSTPVQHSYITGRLLLALAPLILASIVAISRVTDNWHHPHDIFWGGVIGSLIGYAVVRAHYYQPYGHHLLRALQRARHRRGN